MREATLEAYAPLFMLAIYHRNQLTFVCKKLARKASPSLILYFYLLDPPNDFRVQEKRREREKERNRKRKGKR